MNEVFRALNDNNRREILELLKKGDLSAGEIADHFHISKPSVSHHLEILKQAELVSSVKKGQFIIYSLNTSVLDEIFKWFLSFKSNQ